MQKLLLALGGGWGGGGGEQYPIKLFLFSIYFIVKMIVSTQNLGSLAIENEN